MHVEFRGIVKSSYIYSVLRIVDAGPVSKSRTQYDNPGKTETLGFQFHNLNSNYVITVYIFILVCGSFYSSNFLEFSQCQFIKCTAELLCNASVKFTR